jgi:AraC family transcriptional activator of pobA
MVKNGHVPPIRQLTYQPPRPAPVERMSFQALRRLNDGSTQRGDFHVLAVVRRGGGRVSIDFTEHSLTARTAVWIRPGVVHRWADIEGLLGDLVLFAPTAPITPAARDLAADPGASDCWAVGGTTWPLLTAALGHLRLEAAATSDTRTGELLGLLLSALLLRLSPPAGVARGRNDVFRQFRDAVEEDFRSHHDVTHYGRRLGYSPRTLSRAVRAATGRSAKDLLCERLVLEAKRLLVHDRLSPSRCGHRLGFSDAANFSAFFLREVGMRPGAWQSEKLASLTP